MRLASVLIASVLLAGGGAAAAQQHNEGDFHEEVLRRLDRIERMLERIERDSDRASAERPSARPPARQEVVAATNELCGGSCGMAAQNYCRRTGFANGVPLQIERRGIGNFEHVVRARCFN